LQAPRGLRQDSHANGQLTDDYREKIKKITKLTRLRVNTSAGRSDRGRPVRQRGAPFEFAI
jgi:hypothetical protein